MTNVLPDTATSVSAVPRHVPGPSWEFVKNEILRLGAPPSELRSVRAFLANETGFDARAYDALPPRMRRLVDLGAIAGNGLSSILRDGE